MDDDRPEIALSMPAEDWRLIVRFLHEHADCLDDPQMGPTCEHMAIALGMQLPR